MPKLLCTLSLIFSLIFVSIPNVSALPESAEKDAPALSATSAILTDGEGQILASKNAHARMGPASTTKIMTSLVVLESCSPSEMVSIPKEAVGIEGSSIYLCEGELLTVEQLLYATLLASANDAATALALHAAGSEEAFVEKMNERADKLHLTNTHFVNPHGLSDEDHYTTAYDLALITAEALQNDLFCKIVSTYKATIPLLENENGRVLINHNKMLRLYDNAIGVKTGFTKATGRTLVSAAERNGLRLIAVTLDASDDWNDHCALLDYGFSHYERVTLCTPGTVLSTLPVTGGKEDYVTLVATQSLSLTLPKQRELDPVCCITATAPFLYAPVTGGDTVACAMFCYGDATYSVPLIAGGDIARYVPPKKGILSRILHFFLTD